MFFSEREKLFYKKNGEIVCIEPWGYDCLRFRSTIGDKIFEEDWNLLSQGQSDAKISVYADKAEIQNGKITAEISEEGVVRYYTDNDVLLEELWIDQRTNNGNVLKGREYKAVGGDYYRISLAFKAYEGERFYGMGQYAQGYLNLKGSVLDLSQKNTQITIPFLISSRGYGFVWNNPAVGRVELVKNRTLWNAEASKQTDYIIFFGETVSKITRKYSELFGKSPMLPEWALGFWQSKLRYKTQEELINIAREYKKRNLPLSVIVIDFFHWPKQGDWKFDEKYWPRPDKMVRELERMGIKLMVSIWPTVDIKGKNYQEMTQKGLLVRAEKGVPVFSTYREACSLVDVTNPTSRDYMWKKVKENYYKNGIKAFWLDEAEPEMDVHDLDNVRFYLGNGLEVGNIYPFFYVKAFYDGMKSEGEKEIVNLARSAWLGSQRFGAVIWSGDIPSTFESLRNQVKAGLNISLSGIPWWTTDIGGFWGGDPKEERFRELIVRWFQFGVFCPVFRLHGFRLPYPAKGDRGCEVDELTGGDNEVWSFGERDYQIIKELLFLREKMKPYILEQMKKVHEEGIPLMRPLFFDFPKDNVTFDIEDEYMFGSEILVAPVLWEKMNLRRIYLPKGAEWKDPRTGKEYKGGQWIEYKTPLEIIPFFLRSRTNAANWIVNG